MALRPYKPSSTWRLLSTASSAWKHLQEFFAISNKATKATELRPQRTYLGKHRLHRAYTKALQPATTSVLQSITGWRTHRWPLMDMPQLRSIFDAQCHPTRTGLWQYLSTFSRQAIRDPVLICVDTEFNNGNYRAVSEIGLAIFDTRKLNALNTRATPSTVLSYTDFAHYRVRNTSGAHEGFRFGQTLSIHQADVKRVLERIFANPSSLNYATDFNRAVQDTKRQIILVGHALNNDVRVLKHLDFHSHNIVAALDSQIVAGHSIRLESLLEALEVRKAGLHNAGNDAAFTLLAIVKMGLGSGGSLSRTQDNLKKVVQARSRLPKKVRLKQ